VTEREALLKKAQRYLDSAKLLLESGDYDSAVSRIYYAAFFAAEMMLDSLKLEYSSHKTVISAYGKEFAQKGILREFPSVADTGVREAPTGRLHGRSGFRSR
jgi:uncharacterized protein (UPF0332 family)